MKEFSFSKILGLLPVALVKKLLHRYFSRSLIIDLRIPIFTERLSVAASSANRYDIDVVRRNFRKIRCQTIGISIQYQANDESAAAINNFRHKKLDTLYLTTFMLSLHFIWERTVFFQPPLLLCIIFDTRVLLYELYIICLMILYRRSST